jgi:DNA-binding HxlR family transcriptional regulator
MNRKSVGDMQCPVARSLERVGDLWNILIPREAFYGVARFDEFANNLGVATNTLTRRLNDLVESGVLKRRLYSERPPRHEYHLTNLGRSFRPGPPWLHGEIRTLRPRAEASIWRITRRNSQSSRGPRPPRNLRSQRL